MCIRDSRVYFLELVIIAHIAVQSLVFHMVNQVDDTVEEGNVMGDEDEGIFILLQVAFQPVNMLYIQVAVSYTHLISGKPSSFSRDLSLWLTVGWLRNRISAVFVMLFVFTMVRKVSI